MSENGPRAPAAPAPGSGRPEALEGDGPPAAGLRGGNSTGHGSSSDGITNLERSQRELLSLNRTLRALSDCNQALMRAGDEPGFLADICRIFVEDRGHAMVWVGYAEDDDGKSVRPVARAGIDEGYVDALDISWADTERGRGPTGTAIRTGQPAICRNMRTDPALAPWRQEVLNRGWASSAVLPLLRDGKAFGAISIYSKEPDSFPDEEVKVLSELAADISFGIETIRRRAAHAKTAAALCESEEQYRNLFESMEEGFAAGEMIFDQGGRPSDFRYLNVNPAFRRLTGRPAEEIVGRTVREVNPGIDQFWIESFGRVVQSGRSERLDHPVAALGKHFEGFAWRSGIDRFAVVFSDVTDRKKAEERLRLQQAALESAANAVVITGWDGRIQWVNPAFTRLTGYSAVEAIGKNPRFLKSGRHGPEFYKNLWETILAGRVWHGALVNRRRDGSLYSEDMTISPVPDAGGSIRHFVAIKQDVTARIEAEARLRELNETLEQRVLERTAEAEERAVQLSALASRLTHAEVKERKRLAGVLHDHLQQILVAAKFNLESLTERVTDHDLQSLAVRVDELLDESIAECRSLTVGLSPPVLTESGLAAALRWLGRRMQEQHGLRVDLAVADDYEEPGDADVKTFLFDAVRELLFNVVKHSGILEARITLTREDGNLRVGVEDRGRGFDREAVRDLRGDESGFGLFSIQQRLHLIGGTLVVEGAPGLGTRVALRVPMGPSLETVELSVESPAGRDPEKRPGPRGTPGRAGRIRVVIADDHRILREGLIALLRAEPNFEVVGEAADGVEAVELVRSLRPDVVIMDVNMPRLNGIGATRQITAEFPGIRIVGLSMHEDETIAASMREAGAVGFVTKGGRRDALISAVRSAVSGGPGNQGG